jgi:hypothetical protein
MAPRSSASRFYRDGWVYEEKVDGWSILAYKDRDRVRLVSRNGRDHAALRQHHGGHREGVGALAGTRWRGGHLRPAAPVPLRVAPRSSPRHRRLAAALP